MTLEQTISAIRPLDEKSMTAAAIVVLIGMLYLLFRRNKYNDNVLAVHASAAQN